MSQDLLVEMLTREGLHTWLEKGISNVAYLSLGLGLDNFATNTFVEAKVKPYTLLWTCPSVHPWYCIMDGPPCSPIQRNYVPPKPEETTAEVDGGSGEHKSSSENDGR